MVDIPEYEGHYKVDIEGNIYSIKFNKVRKLKYSISRGGYKQVVLFKNGKGKSVFNHIITAIVYLNHTVKERK